MFRKVIVYFTVISFFFAVNISAASMERRSSKSKGSVSQNYPKDSKSSSKPEAIQPGFDPMSTEMTMFELMMYDGGVAWADSVTFGEKLVDVANVAGWGLSWAALFQMAFTGPIGAPAAYIGIMGLSITSITGPLALQSILYNDNDADGQPDGN